MERQAPEMLGLDGACKLSGALGNFMAGRKPAMLPSEGSAVTLKTHRLLGER